MKLFRDRKKWFDNQEHLFYLFLVILIVDVYKRQACFSCIYDYGQILVVGAQHKLGKERYLVTVFAFGFHLIG